MSISRLAFRFHRLAERLLPTPGTVDVRLLTARLNPTPPELSIRNWKLYQFFILILFLLYCVGRLVWVGIHSSKYFPIVEVTVCSMIAITILITLIFWYASFVNASEVYFLVNHASLVIHWCKTEILPAQEVLFSLLVVLALCIPVGFLFLPFAITFDPFQAVFGPHLVVKLTAACVYFGTSLIATIGLLNLTLMSLSFLETLVTISLSYQNVRVFKEKAFRKFVLTYESVQILNQVADISVGASFSHFIMLGICASSLAMYSTVIWFGRIHLLVYMCTVIMSIINIFLALFYTCIASKPGENCQEGKCIWQHHGRSLFMKKVLKSLRTTGIHVGPYAIVNRGLGLRICDDVFNNAVSLLCIEGNY